MSIPLDLIQMAHQSFQANAALTYTPYIYIPSSYRVPAPLTHKHTRQSFQILLQYTATAMQCSTSYPVSFHLSPITLMTSWTCPAKRKQKQNVTILFVRLTILSLSVYIEKITM